MKAGSAALVVFGLLLAPQRAAAQDMPFLTEEEYRWLAEEISGDLAYEHVRYFTRFHRPRGGSPGLMAVARYVEEKAREYGLEDVRLIRQDSDTVPWSNRHGELWLTAPTLRRLASTLQHPLHLSDYSRSARLEDVPVVSVGAGTAAADYEGREVEGALVLAHGNPSRVMAEAVWERGAAGIVTYPDPAVADYPDNSLSRPDQIRWSRIPVESSDGKPATFGFRLTSRQGLELENLLRSGEPVKARVDIESEIGGEKWQVMVEAFIRGSEIDDQDVVLTGHLQEEKFSANDDASGCASVLEIGRALKKLIEAGRIERPRRNLRFWWVTEISSQRQFFADHPEASRSMLAAINQDMVGADQSQDLLRVQNVTRVPFSRFHFLNDVAERVLEFVVEGNRANLAVLQAGGGAPYPRPILARLGSRHRYNAQVIPFHNNTDHMTFNEAPIGVPAITFTNWPDNFIHSSDDDLWNVDRTQLQRNAFAVGTIAYVIARAGSETFGAIASEVQGRALARMAEDLRLGLGWLAASPGNFHQARHQLQQALERELRAAVSLEALVSTEQERAQIRRLSALLESTAGQWSSQLEEEYRARTGQAPPAEVLGDAEQALQDWIPRLTAGPREFLQGRGELNPVAGLHGLMAFEVLNFVDSRRSGLEIYRAVAAQARRAGKHYYGEVRPEAVRDYLLEAEKAGLVAVGRLANSNQ